MLVASLALLSCERPTASRGHEPTSCYDTTSALAATPLKIEEPLYLARLRDLEWLQGMQPSKSAVADSIVL
jgi:hypothetical protein